MVRFEIYKTLDGWKVHDHYRNVTAYSSDSEASCRAFVAGMYYADSVR